MGIEITVDSLEDMCALMCDNVIPEQEKDEKQYYNNTKDEGGGSTVDSILSVKNNL